MRILGGLVAVLLASAAAAAPPVSISTLTLPGGGGYLQPGNPNRGITAVGSESRMARQYQRRQDAACTPRDAGGCEVAQAMGKREAKR